MPWDFGATAKVMQHGICGRRNSQIRILAGYPSLVLKWIRVEGQAHLPLSFEAENNGFLGYKGKKLYKIDISFNVSS